MHDRLCIEFCLFTGAAGAVGGGAAAGAVGGWVGPPQGPRGGGGGKGIYIYIYINIYLYICMLKSTRIYENKVEFTKID